MMRWLLKHAIQREYKMHQKDQKELAELNTEKKDFRNKRTSFKRGDMFPKDMRGAKCAPELRNGKKETRGAV